jgi:hypothetical protein
MVSLFYFRKLFSEFELLLKPQYPTSFSQALSLAIYFPPPPEVGVATRGRWSLLLPLLIFRTSQMPKMFLTENIFLKNNFAENILRQNKQSLS